VLAGDLAAGGLAAGGAGGLAAGGSRLEVKSPGTGLAADDPGDIRGVVERV
jgi:hypothetical protein